MSPLYKSLFRLILPMVMGICTCSVLVAQDSSTLHIADGNAREWPATVLQTERDTKVVYAIQNDNKALYLLIKGGDRMQQMKIMTGGMQVFVDPGGKKNKTVGFNYPLPGKMETMMRIGRGMGRGNDSLWRQRMNDTAWRRQMSDTAWRNKMRDSMMRSRPDSGRRRSGGWDMKKMQQQVLATKKEIELFGFNDESNGLSDVTEAPIKVAIGWDEKDSLVYEITIPFTTFVKPPQAGDKISLGLVLRGMPMPEFEVREGGGDRGGPPGGFGGGGGGMMMMMGGGPGGGMGNPGDFMRIFEENSFWVKYTVTP